MTDLLNSGMPFLARDARGLGMTASQLHTAERDGILRRMLSRVLVDARAPDTRELRIAATKVIAPPHAIVCDDWATWIFGVDTFSPGERHSLAPRLVVPCGRSRVRVDGLLCRQALIPTKDVLEIDGVRITTPARTASDFLRKKWRPYALSAVDSMAHAGLVTQDEVMEFVFRLKGYRGIRQARNLALLIDGGAESPGESWTRLRVVDAGFAIPESQWEVVDRDGSTRYLDLAYPEIMIAVEYDGREFHTARSDGEHDDYRRRLITALGFRIIIAVRSDIFGDDASFEIELGKLLGRVPEPRRW